MQRRFIPSPEGRGRLALGFRGGARRMASSPDSWFRTLVEQPLAGIYVIQDGRFLYVNPRLASLFGYTVEEVLTSKTVADLVAPEDRPVVLENVRKRLDGETESIRYHFRGQRRDGSRIEVEAHGARSQMNGEPVVIGLLLDITEQKRAEEELQLQKDYLEQLIEGAPEGIVLLDRRQRVMRANGEFLRMFGYTAAEVLGRPIDDLIIPGEQAGDAATLTQRVVGGETVHVEAQRRRKDGSLLYVSILGTPVRSRGDQVAVYAIYRDITRRKAMEEERVALLRETQSALRARDEVLAIVSHDLRNPLNAIVMTTDLLLTQASDGVAGDMLRRIKRLTGRMEVLIRDLLDVSSIEAGRLSVEPRPQPVCAMLAEVEEMLQPQAAERGIRLEVSGEEAMVQADYDRMVQVLSNLAGNALKFTPEGGRVGVRAEVAAGEVHFVVEDTGCGIPNEHRRMLFEPFWQGSTGDGAGLGLAIAKGIVEAHGGCIWVESEVGRGTRIGFSLARHLAAAGGSG